jgi:hypothetical protein
MRSGQKTERVSGISALREKKIIGVDAAFQNYPNVLASCYLDR